MKLHELLEGTSSKKPAGTFAGVKFDEPTVDALTEYTKTNKIPQPVNPEKFHTTLLYSRKHLPDYVPETEYSKPLTGKFTGIELWPSHGEEDRKVLVLRYKCSDLSNRHKQLMDEHDAEFDFDEFKPHITLSYDADLDPSELPKFEHPISIIGEYSEELQDD